MALEEMEMEVGTLVELGVKPGDVVEYTSRHDSSIYFNTGEHYRITNDMKIESRTGPLHVDYIQHPFKIVSRAPEEPKLWKDMSDEEKGALLLAHHEGKVIEFNTSIGWMNDYPERPDWHPDMAYRVKPTVRGVTRSIYSGASRGWSWWREREEDDTHKITFNIIDGEPDPDSIKMEVL